MPNGTACCRQHAVIGVAIGGGISIGVTDRGKTHRGRRALRTRGEGALGARAAENGGPPLGSSEGPHAEGEVVRSCGEDRIEEERRGEERGVLPCP